jgi:hypothetical protein
VRDLSRRIRSSRYKPPETPRGLFAGNKSVRYAFITVIFMILFVEVYNRHSPKPLAGPIDDVFGHNPDRLAIVYGTGGDDTEELKNYVQRVAERLGKVLSQDIIIYPDDKVNETLLKNYSLLLYGPVNANRVASRFADHYPFQFEGRTVRVGASLIDRDNWRLVFAVPNPLNHQRYLLVYSGPTDRDVIGINLLGHQNFVHHDTTDYVVAVGDSIVASGYFTKKDPQHWLLAGK